MQTINIKKYDKYKASGIEWIGEIPVEWDIKRLKILANIQTGNTPPKEHSTNTYYSDDGMLWVKPDNLSEFNPITDTKEKLNNEGLKIAKIVPPYTPLICCIGTIGKFGLSAQTVAFNQQINAVIFNKRMLSRFGLYVISCQEEQHWFYANGNVVKILNTQNQGQIVFPCPQITEQQQIVDYLDNKCGKIDRVINTQKNIIEKLKEYKQAVITEAVTKGLDNSAKLKDSGIEWIGKIPEQWKIQKIKYTTKIMRGRFNHRPRNDPKYYDGKFPFIQTGDITNASKYILTFSQTLNELGYSVSKEFPTGSICMTIAANIGDVAILNFNACFPDSIVGFVPTEHVHWNFLYYILYAMKQQFTRNAIISTQLNINVEIIKEILIPVPSFNEQQKIANYLDKKCSEIDNAISEKEQLIEKLTEYKKSLIYECVTGKRKV